MGSQHSRKRQADKRGRFPRWLIIPAVALVLLGGFVYFALPNAPADGSPSWSPDGTKIVFYSERDGNSEIYVMDADGSRPTRLTRHPANDGSPNFSPDGTKIAFDTDRDGNFEIYVMNADGSNPARLTRHPARDVAPAWSPDGRKIAFMSDRSGGFEVWVMDADGANPVQMTRSGSNWFPRWSPDGSKLAFHVGRDVHILDLKDSTDVRLTTDPDNGMYPSWSPDGRRIAFMSWRTGSTEIYVMDADGSHQQRLTHMAAGDAIDPRWSPDGRQIAFVHLPRGKEPGGPKVICVMNADGTNVRRLSR